MKKAFRFSKFNFFPFVSLWWWMREYFSLKTLQLLMFALLIFTGSSQAATIEKQRDLFKQAVQALEAGDYESFSSLADQNTDYLLYPYLQYFDLRQRISSASEQEILHFVETYAELPLSWRLKNRWLFELADQKKWNSYIHHYTGQRNTRLKCNYLYASLNADKSKQNRNKVLKQSEKLWLVGKRQPKECIPIFEQLIKYGRITPKMLWGRIELAMDRGNLKLATELSSTFNKRDKKLVELWKKVYRNPEKNLKLKAMRQNNVVTRKIAYQGIKRLAQRDAEKAKKLWGKMVRRYGVDKAKRYEVQAYIAVRAGLQYHPDALSWLVAIPKKYMDKNVRYWRARTALREEKWAELITAIDYLKPKEKNKHQWRYWLARAQEQVGKTGNAQIVYADIATHTNYYGFLAADRVDQSYAFNSEPLPRNENEAQYVLGLPGVQRTRELLLVDRVSEARSEWNRVMRKLNETQVQVAATLAYEWEWYDNAILTVARTNHRKDLELRFPTPYKDIITLNAETHGINPSWIYGVVRRESAFNVVARSRVGALGLMQLMPGTARLQSKLLGLDKPSTSEILTSEHNILLGSAYLNNMLNKFSGNQVLATAAYNAGPNRVLRWLPKNGSVSADIWVDTIPYKETREYIRAVMAYSTIFQWKLQQDITPLKERMHLISDSLSLANNKPSAKI